MTRSFADYASTLDKPLLSVSGTKAESGDNTIISAPDSGNRIVIVSFCIQNESAIATTMILKDGATAWRRVLGANAGDGVAVTYHAGREKRLSDASPLVFSLSGANLCGYSVDYFIERSNIT